MAHEGTHSRTPSSLTLSEGLELGLLAGKNVDGHWTQFYVYLFTLMGWLSSNISRIGYNEAWIITIASAAFFTLNGIATIRAYVVLSLIIEETTEIARDGKFLSPRVQRFVVLKQNRMKLPMRIPIALLAHIVGAASITYLVWKVATI